MKNARLLAIIDVPIETFMPNTSTKTSIMILQKLNEKDIPQDYPVFMAVAETCGHDRRGNIKEEDDIREIADKFHSWIKKHNIDLGR